jgi:hypothetical protein
MRRVFTVAPDLPALLASHGLHRFLRLFGEGAPNIFAPLIEPGMWRARALARATEIADEACRRQASEAIDDWYKAAVAKPDWQAFSSWDDATRHHKTIKSIAAAGLLEQTPVDVLRVVSELIPDEFGKTCSNADDRHIANVLKKELEYARQLTIVDQYICVDASRRWLRPIEQIIKDLPTPSRAPYCAGKVIYDGTIVIGQKRDETQAQLESRRCGLEDALANSKPGWRFRVVPRGRDEQHDERMHQRYILTQNVGYLIDPGFDCGRRTGVTNINLMARRQFLERRGWVARVQMNAAGSGERGTRQ